MTYDASERSAQGGSPVELYRFARNTKEWFFTSNDVNVTYAGDTYVATTLQRSSIEQTSEQARNALKLTVRRDMDIAELYRVAPPKDIISLTVIRQHRGDNDPAVIWIGRVMNVDWQEGGQAVINCEPVSTSVKRQGLRRLYQRQCPHPWGSAACGVDKEAHKIDTTVTAVSGLTVTVAALLDRPYGGGWIQKADADGNLERRFIRSFSGLTLTLSQAFQDLEEDDAVTVYPGDDHTMATCDGVYDNILNFGGMPYTPTKNPFDGSPVY